MASPQRTTVDFAQMWLGPRLDRTAKRPQATTDVPRSGPELWGNEEMRCQQRRTAVSSGGALQDRASRVSRREVEAEPLSNLTPEKPSAASHIESASCKRVRHERSAVVGPCTEEYGPCAAGTKNIDRTHRVATTATSSIQCRELSKDRSTPASTNNTDVKAGLAVAGISGVTEGQSSVVRENLVVGRRSSAKSKGDGTVESHPLAQDAGSVGHRATVIPVHDRL